MPIGTIVATAAGLAAGTTAFVIVASVVDIVVGIGFNLIAKRIQENRAAENPIGVAGQLRAGGVVPQSFIHGRWATAGSYGYGGTWGTSGKTPNAYLVYRIDLSDLPVEGLVEVWVNGVKSTFDPTDPDTGFGIPVPEFNKPPQGKPNRPAVDHMWIRFYDGTQTTADAYMVSKFGTLEDREYTTAMKGIGRAYAIVTMLTNNEVWNSGFPELKFVIDGIREYDPRNDTSAGGSGAETYGNVEDNVNFSRNPVVTMYNLIRGYRYADEWVWGGQTATAYQLPFDEWAAAMNVCDTLVEGVAQYQSGGEIFFDDEPASVIEGLLTACGGRLAESGGVYKPRVGAVGAAVMTMTDDDVATKESHEYEPFLSLSDVINGISARYIEPEEGWNWKDAPPRLNADWEEEDGGRRLLSAVHFERVSSSDQAQRLMASAASEVRRQRRHSLTLPPIYAAQLEGLDVISWTSARFGYTDKLFGVEHVESKDNLWGKFVLLEVDPSDYDVPLDIVAYVPVPPVLVPTPAQDVVDFDVTPVQLSSGTRAIPALLLEWSDEVEDVGGLQYEVYLEDAVTLVVSEETDAWDVGQLYVTTNLLAETTYKVRARYRPTSPRPTNWTALVTVTTLALAIADDDLSLTVQARLQQIEETFPQQITELHTMLEQLAAGVDSHFATIVERLGRLNLAVGARYEENKAGVEVVASAQATQESALSQFFVDLLAQNEEGGAYVNFRARAAAIPEGALAQVALELRAGPAEEDVFASASMSMTAYYDVGDNFYYSRIELNADYLDFVVGGVKLPGHLLVVASEAFDVPIVAATATVDLSQRRLSYITQVDGDVEIQFPNNPPGPNVIWRHIIQMDGTGGHTVTFAAEYVTAAPTIEITADTVTVLEGYILSTSPAKAMIYRIAAADLSGDPLPTAGSQDFTVPGLYSFVVPAHGTIRIEVWGGGGGGGAGGAGSFNKGEDGEDGYFGSDADVTAGRIPTRIIAEGGVGGWGDKNYPNDGNGGAGGTASGGGGTGGGNYSGDAGGNEAASVSGAGGDAASDAFGDGGVGGASVGPTNAQRGNHGTSPGGGGSGGKWTSGPGGGGGGGAKATRVWVVTLTEGDTIELYVPEGGRGEQTTSEGGNGANGRVRVTWS